LLDMVVYELKEVMACKIPGIEELYSK